MGFFQTFWTWLGNELTTYIATNTVDVATALEPAVVTLGTLYVMVWGYLQLTGQIQEPFLMGLKRIGVLALVLGAGLRLWLYNDVLVDTFYRAPAEFAAAVIGAQDPVQTIDAIWNQGGAVADQLWRHGILTSGILGFLIASAFVWVLIGFVCVYTMFLIALSSIALSVLLAVGPLFIVMLLFERTQRLFDAWLAQLTNYALVTILTIMVVALLLQILQSYALQTAALGSALQTTDCLNMLLVAVLVLLVMRQVLPIAAGLAGGVALGSYGLISKTLNWPVRKATAIREGAALARNSRENVKAFAQVLGQVLAETIPWSAAVSANSTTKGARVS